MTTNGSSEVLVPMATVACPVHGRLVLASTDGKLLGRCSDCVKEAEDGLRLLLDRIRGREEAID